MASSFVQPQVMANAIVTRQDGGIDIFWYASPAQIIQSICFPCSDSVNLLGLLRARMLCSHCNAIMVGMFVRPMISRPTLHAKRSAALNPHGIAFCKPTG